MLYIVVPTYNRTEIFYKFVKQMEKQKYQEYVLIVVDHGKYKTNYSADNAYVIDCDVNGWSYAINVGIRFVMNELNASMEDYILVINDDVLMDEDYLDCVHNAIMQRPNSLIGSACYEWNTGKVLHLNMKLNRKKATLIYRYKNSLRNKINNEFYDSDVLKGRGTVLPVRVLNEIGLYNEKKLPHYRADHELAWRAKKRGYDVCVSGNMWLGAILDSPHRMDLHRTFFENYRRIFKDMISVQNTRDLWNYSFCCYELLYGCYFFMINSVRDHLKFVLDYWKGEKNNG